MNVEASVRQFLHDELGKDVTQLGPDDSLLESGTIDSVGVMALVAYLERDFGVAIGEDDLVPENFDSLSAIAAFVDRRRTEDRG